MGASTQDQDFDESIVKNQVVNKFTLEKKIKHLITDKGIYGMRFLHKVFKCLDQDRIGILEENDFRWGLQSGKVHINEEEANFLVSTYASKGGISYRDFLNDLRGKLNENRVGSIVDAYKRIQKIGG